MNAVIGRTVSTARRVVVMLVVTSAVVWSLTGSAEADDAPADQITWSTTWTQEETVTVTETATVDGFEGTGSATATASATETGTATAATWWEVYYYASVDAYQKASAAAKAKATEQARPIAIQNAEADARAKAEAAGPKTWSTEYTATETVTVTETATVDGFEGTGSGTATATATATGTATAATWWEVAYYASVDAYQKASAAAKAKATEQARPIAKQNAEADARAKAEAAGPKTWSTEQTVTQTVTVTETAMVDGFKGEGTATSTKTATATGTATADTWWEVYYWAVQDAYLKAREQAWDEADQEARAEAKRLAQADAQAKADAAAEDPDDPTTPPEGPSCGPEVLKKDGTPWVCTFSDEFQGTSLDETKWTALETATSGFDYGDCFVGTDDGVEVGDGAVRLTTAYHDDEFTCDHPDAPFQTHYTSGSLTSLGKFSQTYGRFEIRAAMPVTHGPGTGSALWLVPDTPHFYGSWPTSGEIDIAEFYASFPDRVIPTLHYNSVVPFPDRTNNYCYVYKPTNYHTYLLEWTDKKITISVDGTVCLDHTLSPLPPLTNSAPFDRPFNINLTQTLGEDKYARPAGTEIESATMSIDYVRVWS